MFSGKQHSVPAEVFPKRTSKILWREVEGSAVLFHEDNGRAFALNETAARVWEMCDGTRSLGEISSRLGELYALDGATAPDTVAALVSRLAEDGCVEMVAPTGHEADMAPEPADAPAPPSEAWCEPVVEEIVFAACDCTSGGTGGKGVVRNAQCVSTPRQIQSSI